MNEKCLEHIGFESVHGSLETGLEEWNEAVEERTLLRVDGRGRDAWIVEWEFREYDGAHY